jgi:hypothetical protein
MKTKSLLQSKTINVNSILLGIFAAMSAFNINVPSGLYEALLAAIPLVNIILRLVTKNPIQFGGGK